MFTIKQDFFFLALILLTASSITHGQKRIAAADSLYFFSQIKKAEQLANIAKYDSALALANDALTFSKKNQYKKGEATAYDRLAEIMLLYGKMGSIRQYDSVGMPIATQIKDTALLINYWNRAGVYNMELGKHKDAEKYFTQALQAGVEKRQNEKTAEIYSNLASLHLAMADKDKAIEGFFQALRLYEKNDNEKGQGETLSNISSVYYLMGRVDEAIDYQKKSIVMRERKNDIPGLVITNTNIGQLYILRENYPLALTHLQQSVKYAEQINNPKSKASAYSGMSVYFSRTKDFATALEWQSKAIKLFEETDNVQMLSRLYVAAGNLANVTKDSTTALNYYNKALALAIRLDNKENIGNAYEKLSIFFQSHSDFEKAYHQYKKFITYKDSIAGNSTIAKIEEIKTRYETEKKDNEIARLNTEQKIRQLEIEKQKAVIDGNASMTLQKQNEIDLLSKSQELRDVRIKQQGEELEKQFLLSKTNLQQLEITEKENLLRQKQLKNQKLVRNLLIGGLGLFVLLGLTFFNRYQLKKKLEQQKNLLAIRNNISQDLHDDIGASLSNINILNELAKRNIEQPEKSKEYLSKASEDIQRISESLSDIVWNINPRYDDLQNLFIRMKRYAADMLDGKNIEGQFEFPSTETSPVLGMTQRRDLYLIFKEAVNNLVKYSGAKQATITVSADAHFISMFIKDDGKGFDRNAVKTGNGLQNMEHRAKASGAEVSIVTEPGIGTAVNLKMRIV
jgi:two-component system, NarL family, sensor histidine kinase UhpB